MKREGKSKFCCEPTRKGKMTNEGGFDYEKGRYEGKGREEKNRLRDVKYV